MTRFLIGRYHEITLKGKNRRFFEMALRENLKKALKGLAYKGVRRGSGRIFIELDDRSDSSSMEERISMVFGISSYSTAWRSSVDLNELGRDLWNQVQQRSFESFRIDARGATKLAPYSSTEANRHLGGYIQERSGARVQMKDPDLTCYVEFSFDSAFFFFEKHRGAGGLPVSTSGRVIALLSGGIDSPVAAHRIIKRGCRVIFVHFHSFPFTTLDSQQKVRDLVDVLNRYQFYSVVHWVPFADCQRKIVAASPAHSRVLLYRRLMLRIAEKIAWKVKAAAIVTGDSLGQVASQTLQNTRVVDRVAVNPVLRPLIGDDKGDIVAEARRIGTYDISIQPHDDCCSLFVPKHPATQATLKSVERIEEGLDLEDMARAALEETIVERTEFGSAGGP